MSKFEPGQRVTLIKAAVPSSVGAKLTVVGHDDANPGWYLCLSDQPLPTAIGILQLATASIANVWHENLAPAKSVEKMIAELVGDDKDKEVRLFRCGPGWYASLTLAGDSVNGFIGPSIEAALTLLYNVMKEPDL